MSKRAVEEAFLKSSRKSFGIAPKKSTEPSNSGAMSSSGSEGVHEVGGASVDNMSTPDLTHVLSVGGALKKQKKKKQSESE